MNDRSEHCSGHLAAKLGEEASWGRSWVKPDGLIEATLPGGSLEGDLLGEGEDSRLGEQCPKFRSSQDRVSTESDRSTAPRAARTNTRADLKSPWNLSY
jgi:hypothetical protein